MTRSAHDRVTAVQYTHTGVIDTVRLSLSLSRGSTVLLSRDASHSGPRHDVLARASYRRVITVGQFATWRILVGRVECRFRGFVVDEIYPV